MTIYTLKKTGGGDYTTLPEAFTAISGFVDAGLGDSITLNIEGGQEYGTENVYYTIGGSNLVFNNYNIIIQTDPASSTPAKLTGRFNETSSSTIPATSTVISFNDLILQNAYTLGEISSLSSAIWPTYNNCLIYLNSNFIYVGTADGQNRGAFNNCSIFVVKDNASTINFGENPGQTFDVDNCLICGYRDTDLTFGGSDGYELDSCTFYNYGAGDIVVNFVNTPTNSVVDTNPNLTAAVITSFNDLYTAMSARDASITETSVAILDNANITTATTTDILGTARPQGTDSDRGAYELLVTPAPDREGSGPLETSVPTVASIGAQDSDKIETLDELKVSFPVNNEGLVKVQNVRDFLVSVFGVYGCIYTSGGSTPQSFTDTPTKVAMWLSEVSKVTTVSASNGNITIGSESGGGFLLIANISCTGEPNTVFQFHFKSNGIDLPWRCRVVTDANGNAGTGTILGFDTAVSDTVIDLYGESNDGGGKNCTFTDASMALYRIS